MSIIIVGCPRSGTRSAAVHYGVGHENPNPYGISSWYLVPKDPDLPFHTYMNPDDFWRKIHIMRNPLETIRSMHTLMDVSWDFLNKHTGCFVTPTKFSKRGDRNKLGTAAWAWLAWYRLIEKNFEEREVVKVETLREVENVRAKVRPAVTLEELHDVRPGICKEIEAIGRKFKYW